MDWKTKHFVHPPTGIDGWWSVKLEEAEARLAAMRAENLQLHQLLHNADVASEAQEKALAAAEAVRCKNCNVREEHEAALAEAEKRISERNAEVRALHGELAEAQAQLAAAENFSRRCVTAIDESNARISALEATLEAEVKAHSVDVRLRHEAEAEVRETNLEMAAVNHCNVEQAKEIARLKAIMHYPDCWDTCAYPTLADAVQEIFYCSDPRHKPAPPAPARPEPKRKPDPWQNHDARKRGRRSK